MLMHTHLEENGSSNDINTSLDFVAWWGVIFQFYIKEEK
jgi:hypothetical protein